MSWVEGAEGSGFGVEHLPYGVIDVGGRTRPAVRIGAHALDLTAAAAAGLLPDAPWLAMSDLSGLLAAGPQAWAETRERLQDALAADQRPPGLPADALVPLADAGDPVLPFAVADYVDFYSSLHHATNLGRLFRPDSDPLLPNWRHLPIGYHGRAGTVVVTGTGVQRPVGQRRPPEPGAAPPVGPSSRLDIELELGFVTGGPATELGSRVAADDAAQHIFGVMLVNDWSARDIQAWEYQPLGPFLGKSFATSIAAWITPLAALDHAWVPAPPQDPEPADHLQVSGDWGLDLTLEVALQPAGAAEATTISRVGFADMYWTMPQQLAHASSNGATVRPGDLFASGTVSGPERGTEGSLIEMTFGGAEPIDVAGVERTFLQDGDTVVLRGHAGSITLAECVGTILPALE